ncbi:hypothetical protein L7F22_005566 [Adiantum nelumboides]|nr:hypothetical protein [Adiantum nelumboides]
MESLCRYIMPEHEHMIIDAHVSTDVDDDDEISLAEFLASQKRKLRCSNVFQNMDTPRAIDTRKHVCDDEQFMQGMQAMDDALVMHAMSNHEELMQEPALIEAMRDDLANVHANKLSTSHAHGKGFKLVKMQGKMHKPLAVKVWPSHMHDAEDSSDEHASVGEEKDCKDELLKAKGPVLHESDVESDLADVCMPTWKSGDTMHVEFEGTFKKLPMFVDIASIDMGQIQLFLALLPTDWIEMIVHEINRYAFEKRERVLCNHESTKSWDDLDRHSFLRFLDTKELSDIGIQCISHYDWHEDPLGTPIFPIPKNEIFHINGVAFEVRLSCIQGAGYGLFVHSAIESGLTILHYGGPKYGFQEWKKICKLIPRAIKYSLVEDPKVEEEEDRAYILGFVEEGNVSGYINSSHFRTTSSAASSRSKRSKKSSNDDERTDTHKEEHSQESAREDVPKEVEAAGPSEYEKSDEEDISTSLEKRSQKPSSREQVLMDEAMARVEAQRKELADARAAKAAKTARPTTMEEARKLRIEKAKALQKERKRIEAEEKAQEEAKVAQATQIQEKEVIDLSGTVEYLKKIEREKHTTEQRAAQLAREKIKEASSKKVEEPVLEPSQGSPKRPRQEEEEEIKHIQADPIPSSPMNIPPAPPSSPITPFPPASTPRTPPSPSPLDPPRSPPAPTSPQ